MEVAMSKYTDEEIRDYYRNNGTLPREVFDDFNRKAFRILISKGSSAATAEDMMQDAWIRFLAVLPRFEITGPNKLIAYFLKTCINLYFAFCKTKSKERDGNEKYRHDIISQGGATISPEREEELVEAKKQELIACLRKHMEKMTLNCRERFRLRFEEGLSHKEIDEIMGSENTGNSSSAKSIFHRCVKRLRAFMKKHSI